MAIFLNSEKKIKNSWWVVIFFLILASFLFPLIILAEKAAFEITMAHQAAMIAVVSIICQLFRGKAITELTGEINFIWLKQLCTGISMGAALMGFPVLLLTAFGQVHWRVDELSFSTILSGFSIFLTVVIAEELLFRGFIFQRLIQAFGKLPAQFIIAFLFLLTHVNNPGMIGTVKVMASVNIFVASIMFGISFIKTKSLAMPIGLHFMANFMQGTILGFGVSGSKEPSLLTPIVNELPIWISGGEFGVEASIGGLFFVTLLTIYLYYWDPSKNKTISVR